jgi:hypothetical protein
MVLATALGRFAHAQAGGVTVRGVAFDSLRNAPLPGALVSMAGVSRTTFADSRGRFEFETVTPGTYRLEMQHPVLDTIGLSGVTRSVRVTDGRDEVRVAVPSFETLWNAACRGIPVPRDSGFVFGTVRNAVGGGRMADAMIDLTWIDVSNDKETGLKQRRWRAQARTDANGDYEVCGVPTELDLRVRATTDSSASGLIDILPRGLRVQRRDLVVGPADTAVIRRGTIVGTVTDTSGKPVASARVITDGVPEVRSDSAGRFLVRSVPAGTRQIEVLALGMSPSLATADIVPGDTALIAVQLRRITTLDVVRVTASARQRRLLQAMEDRKRIGLGKLLDSTSVGAMGTMSAVFSALPSVEVVRGRFANQFIITLPALGRARRCVATLFIDGIRQAGFRGDAQSAYDMLNALHTDEIAAIEVFAHALMTPAEFMVPGDPCGAVAVWTKAGLR